MAQREAEKLRRELDRVEGRQGSCFPPELKLRAARRIAEQRAGGARVAEIAAELGLAEGTVLRWSSEAKLAPTRALVPVEIVPDPVAARTVSIVSPSGFRVDGLSLLEAAALLRSLELSSAPAAPFACSRTRSPSIFRKGYDGLSVW